MSVKGEIFPRSFCFCGEQESNRQESVMPVLFIYVNSSNPR